MMAISLRPQLEQLLIEPQIFHKRPSLFPALDLESKALRINSFSYSYRIQMSQTMFSAVVAALLSLPTTMEVLDAKSALVKVHCLDQQSNRG